MTTPKPPTPLEEIMPRFAEINRDVLFGEVWERPGLSKRDRSLITVAALTVLYRSSHLKGHVKRALDNGVTKEELLEVFMHLAFYGGWPVAGNAFGLAEEAFNELGLS